MRLYRAKAQGCVVRLSPDPIAPDDLPTVCVMDEIDREVPTVLGTIEDWRDEDGALRPHIHYVCPRCATEHNVDLVAEDSSPRFACCDSCAWDSVVWIEWRTR